MASTGVRADAMASLTASGNWWRTRGEDGVQARGQPGRGCEVRKGEGVQVVIRRPMLWLLRSEGLATKRNQWP